MTTTRERIGAVIGWWCNGLLVVYVLLVVVGYWFSTEPTNMTIAAALLGIPVGLIFLVGKSVRYVLGR